MTDLPFGVTVVHWFDRAGRLVDTTRLGQVAVVDLNKLPRPDEAAFASLRLSAPGDGVSFRGPEVLMPTTGTSKRRLP